MRLARQRDGDRRSRRQDGRAKAARAGPQNLAAKFDPVFDIGAEKRHVNDTAVTVFGSRDADVLRTYRENDRAVRGPHAVGSNHAAPGKRDAAVLRRAFQDVRAAQKFGGEPVARRAVEVMRVANLDNATRIHEDHTIGKRQRLRLVVRHIDRRHAEPTLQRADIFAQLLAQLCIEVESGSSQEHVGLDHKRPRQRYALLLAARKFSGIAPTQCSEIDETERALHALTHLSACKAPHLETEANIRLDAHVRKECVRLEHQSDVAPLRWQTFDPPVAKPDLAAIGIRYSGDHAKHGGLAASRGAKESDKLAIGDVKIELFDRDGRMKRLPQRFQVGACHSGAADTAKAGASAASAVPRVS
jgi:hypothetical protein